MVDITVTRPPECIKPWTALAKEAIDECVDSGTTGTASRWKR